jgi:transmembrane sensor
MSATPDAEEPTAPQLVEITSTRSSAKELFESAERHRLAGQLREAATALDTLRRRYPGDPRAALAAFELGRIRMDSFGDFSGAMLAFNSALKLNPSASFREDAEARLIKLYERTGQREACKKAQQAYLARYPRGNHVGVVGNACGQ